ncbi:MAG: non-canonical purine NTP pyrophosphatase [Brevinema sp.]
MKSPFSLVIASQNLHKIEEIRQMLPYSIICPQEKKDIPETGTTYIENALIKARAWAELYPDAFILADDSGVEVSALNGAPGVISADWAGVASSQEKLIEKMLVELEGTPLESRGASMVCTMLLLAPKGNIFVSRGETLGRIALEPRGTQGFGFNPLFLSADFGYQKTFAELSAEQRNRISHRSRALAGVRDFFASNAYQCFL